MESKLYNFCLFEKYLILYSYKSNIQFMDLSSKKLSSEKIKNISKKEIEVQSLYTIYSTDIPSIENETLFLTNILLSIYISNRINIYFIKIYFP